MREIGKRIRDLRQQRRLTLEDLSSQTGLSKSFISEAERGIASLTITSLQKVATALDVELSYFFPAPSLATNGVRVTRPGERTEFRMEVTQDWIYSSLAAGFAGRVLEPLMITLLPGYSHVEPYSHPGEEFVLVLEGTLTVLVEDKEFQLVDGDTIHLASQIPHNWENRTDSPVKVVAVSTPKLF
ncbi:MAG: XRE family transcriptional regulator [Bacillota bacterium]|jgi:transcriptional regulator with XRE-family HTH domain